MRSRVACLALAVLAGIFVVGCGSKDDSGSSAPPSPDKAKAMSGPAGAPQKAPGAAIPNAPN